MPAVSGRYPSGQRGQTVNLLANAFGGSNPPLPTTWTGMPPEGATGRSRARALGVLQAKTSETGGNSSAVERQPSKLGVAGSNPVSRSKVPLAHVAQLAEHALGKGEVSGSIPDMGSSSELRNGGVNRYGRF